MSFYPDVMRDHKDPLLVASGAFNTSTAAATNTVALTGFGFTPKVILFWWTGATTTGGQTSTSLDSYQGFGWAVSTSQRGCIGTFQEDAVADTDTDRAMRDDACIVVMSTTTGIAGLMDLQSMDSDGATLVIDDAFPFDLRVQYLALGGNTLEAACGQFNSPTGTGNQSITGVGFTPECVFTLGVSNLSTTLPAEATSAAFVLGAASSTAAADQAILSAFSTNGAATQDTSTWCRSGYMAASAQTPGGTVGDRGQLNSFDGDGFTINWEGADATSRPHLYLALRGCEFKVGNFTMPTSSTVAVTGVGFQPSCHLWFGAGKAADGGTATSANYQVSIGGGISTGSERATCVYAGDGALTGALTLQISNALSFRDADGAGSVRDAELQSYDADGFTANVTAAGGVAAFTGFFVGA